MSSDTPGGSGFVPDFANPDDIFDPGKRDSTRLDPNDGFIEFISDNWPRNDPGLRIGAGGVVAVDTESLRSAAAGFDGAREELAAIGATLAGLRATLRREAYFAHDAQGSASLLAEKLESAQIEAEGIADALRETAYGYEYVELAAATRAALAAGDDALASELGRRLESLVAAHPGVLWAGLTGEFGRAIMWPSELVRQGTQWGVSAGGAFSDVGAIGAGFGMGMLTIGGAVAVGMSGIGRVPRDAKLTGGAGPVTVVPVSTTTTTHAGAVAPRSLTDLTERMPSGGESRVRVERYTMADGSKEYVVYIAGTQSQSVVGGDDPWDHVSNAQLYTGQMSDSYAATAAAVAAAGAEPGDTVHIAGLSQGGMIGTHLALEGGYSVPTLVTAGAPVSGEVGPETLRIELRHSDDPVSGLAGGGYGESVGAPGSFVAERIADPDGGLGDLTLPAHNRQAYIDTAAMVDASSDPRVDAVAERLNGLAQARSVTVTEYSAARGDG